MFHIDYLERCDWLLGFNCFVNQWKVIKTRALYQCLTLLLSCPDQSFELSFRWKSVFGIGFFFQFSVRVIKINNKNKTLINFFSLIQHILSNPINRVKCIKSIIFNTFRMQSRLFLKFHFIYLREDFWYLKLLFECYYSNLNPYHVNHVYNGITQKLCQIVILSLLWQL